MGNTFSSPLVQAIDSQSNRKGGDISRGRDDHAAGSMMCAPSSADRESACLLVEL